MGMLPKTVITVQQPLCSGRHWAGFYKGPSGVPPSPELCRLSALLKGGDGAFLIDVDHPRDVAGALGALFLRGGPLPVLHLLGQHLLPGSLPLQPLQHCLQLHLVPQVRGVAPCRQAEEASCGERGRVMLTPGVSAGDGIPLERQGVRGGRGTLAGVSWQGSGQAGPEASGQGSGRASHLSPCCHAPGAPPPPPAASPCPSVAGRQGQGPGTRGTSLPGPGSRDKATSRLCHGASVVHRDLVSPSCQPGGPGGEAAAWGTRGHPLTRLGDTQQLRHGRGRHLPLAQGPHHRHSIIVLCGDTRGITGGRGGTTLQGSIPAPGAGPLPAGAGSGSRPTTQGSSRR